jgi:glycerol-3-phosphate dehydrogenase
LRYDMDILVMGAGVNGTGISWCAVGRGFSMTLCEQEDLAARIPAARAASMIHGGLCYLERYEFRLVARALAWRRVILRLARHITRPLLFVLRRESRLRPAWMIQLGLILV